MEVYQLIDGRYARILPNQRGHYEIAPMGVELGIQEKGSIPWLRWWDSQGNLLLNGDERAELERQKSDRLAAQLRALGVEQEA